MLRFPEFEEAGEWAIEQLGKVADLRNGYAFKSSTYVESGEFRIITISNVQEGILTVEQTRRISKLPSDIQPHQILKIGDFLMSLTGNVGRVCKVDLPSCLLNQRVGKIVAIDIDPSFLYSVLQSEEFRNTMQLRAAGGAQGNLSSSSVLTYPFAYPESEKEQQKIAATLSALDDLLTAHSAKLAALQGHKRGLMQGLFPAEGETVPKLRFPEFREAGEWEEKTLGKLTKKVGSGITPTGGDKNYKTQGLPFVRSQNVGWGKLLLDDVAFIDQKTHDTFPATEIKERDVLLNITGASIGRCAVADSSIAGGNVNQHVCIIRTTEELNPFFLSQYLIASGGQNQIDSFQAGGNRQGLNFVQIRSFQIPTPPTLEEQQKIADCLSSLDNRITAQIQQIEALKLHKKGLMQGLFPAAAEPTA